MEERHFENKQVEKARTRICGHLHSIEIQLCFNDCIICINPKRNWFSKDGKTMPFFDLFECFDMDCEDGADIERITGKYCRILFDGCTPIAIYHIVKNKFVEIKDLQ